MFNTEQLNKLDDNEKREVIEYIQEELDTCVTNYLQIKEAKVYCVLHNIPTTGFTVGLSKVRKGLTFVTLSIDSLKSIEGSATKEQVKQVVNHPLFHSLRYGNLYLKIPKE